MDRDGGSRGSPSEVGCRQAKAFGDGPGSLAMNCELGCPLLAFLEASVYCGCDKIASRLKASNSSVATCAASAASLLHSGITGFEEKEV